MAAQSRSVFIQGIPPSATEDFLKGLFTDIGEVEKMAVKQKQDRQGRLLCYAFATFVSHEVAERAIAELNYTKLDGVPIRIMWGDNETKQICKVANGNLFVKNLDRNIEDSQLHEAFANFGEIISCKICVDKDGKSLGYGYVQFRKPDDARQAMEDLKDASINGMPLQIQPFQKKLHKNPEDTYMNIYIKNLPDEIEKEEDLINLFQGFGEVSSVFMPLNDEGKPRGFAMCSMADHESAVRAVEGLNGMDLGGKKLECCRHMSKPERLQQIQIETEKWRRHNYEKYNGRNLYVRGFDELVVDDDLKELFGQYGEIESVRIMRDEDNNSRKFGFVCFADVASADKAVRDSALVTLGGKSIFVARALPRTERKKQNVQKFEERGRQQRVVPNTVPLQGPAPTMGIPGYGPGMPNAMLPPMVPSMIPSAPPAFPYAPYQMAPYPFAMFPTEGQQAMIAPVPNQQDRDKLRQTIMEEKGHASPLLSKIRNLSDDQVKFLVSDQELLRKWYDQV
jgi:polyadenylate-binding protein